MHALRVNLRHAVLAVLALAVLAAPTAAVGAGAEQIVITLVDEPAPWEFEDPCRGGLVQGLALENGIVRITELGDRGHHVRLHVEGVVDLVDGEGDPVGTWTYSLVFTDEFPPDGQGAVHMTASGPIAYADGGSAILHVAHHHVFAKGDVEKFPARDTAKCSRLK
jgi:hypothetical protein